MKIYIVHYVSASGGHRGFSTYENRGEALAARDYYTKRGYSAWVESYWRD